MPSACSEGIEPWHVLLALRLHQREVRFKAASQSWEMFGIFQCLDLSDLGVLSCPLLVWYADILTTLY